MTDTSKREFHHLTIFYNPAVVEFLVTPEDLEIFMEMHRDYCLAKQHPDELGSHCGMRFTTRTHDNKNICIVIDGVQGYQYLDAQTDRSVDKIGISLPGEGVKIDVAKTGADSLDHILSSQF